jgi:hypothetical protein
MNRALFVELSNYPDRVDPIHKNGLEELVKSFPFFQVAKVLYCLSLKKGQEIGYAEALKSAALHTSNRRRLFEVLESKQQEKCKEDQVVSVDPVSQKSPIDIQFESEERIKNVMKQAVPLDEIIRQIVEYPLIIEDSPKIDLPKVKPTEPLKVNESDLVVQKRPSHEEKETQLSAPEIKVIEHEQTPEENSFLFWLKKVNDRPAEIKHETNVQEKESVPSKSREELIDNFIKTEPRISAPQKVDFYSPIAMSKKSSEDSEEIVSETLAKIYEAQANHGKAIRIYQKLSLLYPEKSSYFAARIKNLEKTDLL